MDAAPLREMELNQLIMWRYISRDMYFESFPPFHSLCVQPALLHRKSRVHTLAIGFSPITVYELFYNAKKRELKHY